VADKRRRRTAAALATSALLHLAAAVLILRGLAGQRPLGLPRAAPEAPIEIALVETPPAPTSAGATRTPPTAPPAPPAPRRPASSRPGPPAVPTAPPAPSAPTPTPPAPVRPVDLSFDALASSAKQRAAAAPSPGEALERLLVPAPEPAGPHAPLAELRADAERRADAVENVRTGRAHPLLFDYLRDARDRLTPAARRIAEALPLGASETTRGWTRGYLGAVAQAQRGAFAPVKPDAEPSDISVWGPHPDVLGAYNEADRQGELGAEERAAEICLGVAPGHAVVVTLRRSSGNAALDRLAFDSFRAAGDGHAPTADVRPALACYRVRVSAYRAKPLPTISFDFAARRLIYPLKRLTNVSVELESVDFGSKPQTSPLLHTPP
jgi:hypothetical protein